MEVGDVNKLIRTDEDLPICAYFVRYSANMRNYQKCILLIITMYSFFVAMSCRPDGIGGAGWDDKRDVETARKYPAIESSRVLVTTSEVPYQTFKQEFDNVFKDFQYSGGLIAGASESLKTKIEGTPYSVSYENFVLKVFRDDEVIAERNLPKVFYMHSMSSGAIIGKSRDEDRILCRTLSRGTTGLHYVFISDGNGDILFEKVVAASEDWDILPGDSGEIIIGGSRTRTVISQRK